VEDYRTVKVRILNGAHTSMIPYAMLCGVETVGECLQDERTADHLRACLAEILCSMEGDAAENRAYADAVLERFANPYIRHLCKAISLNSVSKFKVRVLPSILAYKQKTKKSPAQLLFALAMLVKFYKEGTPTDDEAVIRRFKTASVAELLSDAALWGVSLAEYVAEVEQYANSPL
jgi:tagaturonate reductase